MDENERIVAGVLTAVHSEMNPKLGELLEMAMTDAVHQALAQGISVHDSEAILARKQAAYDAVMSAIGG